MKAYFILFVATFTIVLYILNHYKPSDPLIVKLHSSDAQLKECMTKLGAYKYPPM